MRTGLFPAKRFESSSPSGFPSSLHRTSASWSWKNHPLTSERFANALLNHIDLLGDFPYLGAPMHGRPGVRRLQHWPLHIYYRGVLEPRRVEILHFWHMARKDSTL